MKILHYCWFGGNELPEKVLKCIDSWKKNCPDYEIKKWDETNFDVNICKYVREAYDSKKWAFVSDYARYWILYNYGGIYLDTDVEVIKKLDDLPLNFIGFETPDFIASGLIRGAQKGDYLCKEILESFHNDSFIKDSELNLETICVRETKIFIKHGLIPNNRFQIIKDTYVYPTDYFNPKSFISDEILITENTYSIHHYDSTWYTEQDKYTKKLKKKISKFLPLKLSGRIANFIGKCKYQGFRKALKSTFRKIRGKKND